MMSRHGFQRDDSIMLSLTPDIEYDFNSPDALLQRPTWASEAGEANNNKKESKVTKIIEKMNPWWSTISVMACAIAVSMDPLFFYIPYIDDDKKCLGMDKELRNAALISRSFTDITFMVHIIYEIHTAIKAVAAKSERSKPYDMEWDDTTFDTVRAVMKNLSWGSFLTDILALLPIPQVLIVAVFFNMRGPRYLQDRKAVCFFVLAQYIPRMYRIYLSSNKLRKSTALWLKGAFNFFMYIIASHILGAFWYFFSIQRVTACWHQTYCKTTQGCATTYYCDNTDLIDIPLINGSCPVSPPDPEKFDFGMFSDGLKSGNTGPISFSVKLSYTLWWGLRNLSNFGTSLVTSTYAWENFFAILISVVGLVLFSYLIGNMQQCMQWEEEKKVGSDKFKLIKDDLEKWMKNNDLDDAIKEEIMNTIKKKLEDGVDFDAANLDNVFSVLPWNTRKALKRGLCMNMLRKVPMLNQVDEKVLKMMCDYLKPVKYQEDTMVFQMGVPFDRMVFITDGSMWTYTTATDHQTSHSGKATSGGLVTSSSMEAQFLEKGDAYGHMLLHLASSSSFKALPISVANVKCQSKVEAFVLTANDLRNIVTACGDFWPAFDYNASQDEEADQKAPAGPKKRTVATSNIHPTGYSG